MLWLILNLLIVLVGIAVVVAVLVRKRYRVGEACFNCGYSLEQLESETCPECGDPLDYRATEKEARRRAGQARRTISTVAFWSLLVVTLPISLITALRSPIEWVQYTTSEVATIAGVGEVGVEVLWLEQRAQPGELWVADPTVTVVVTLPDATVHARTLGIDETWNSDREPCESWLGSLAPEADPAAICVVVGRVHEETQRLGRGQTPADDTNTATWFRVPLGRCAMLGLGLWLGSWLICVLVTRLLVSDRLFLRYVTEERAEDASTSA